MSNRTRRAILVDDEAWDRLLHAAAQRTQAEGTEVSRAELVRRGVERELAECERDRYRPAQTTR